MAKAESLGVLLTLTGREAEYLYLLTGKQTGQNAKELVGEDGDVLNVGIYAALGKALTGEDY